MNVRRIYHALLSAWREKHFCMSGMSVFRRCDVNGYARNIQQHSKTQRVETADCLQERPVDPLAGCGQYIGNTAWLGTHGRLARGELEFFAHDSHQTTTQARPDDSIQT